MTLPLTAIERDILERMRELHAARGFPPLSEIRATRREHTGVGRFVDLQSDADIDLPDGPGELGEYSVMAMEGLSDVLLVLVFIKGRRLSMLELVTIDEPWDGVERPWRYLEPPSYERTA